MACQLGSRMAKSLLENTFIVFERQGNKISISITLKKKNFNKGLIPLEFRYKLQI